MFTFFKTLSFRDSRSFCQPFFFIRVVEMILISPNACMNIVKHVAARVTTTCETSNGSSKTSSACIWFAQILFFCVCNTIIQILIMHARFVLSFPAFSIFFSFPYSYGFKQWLVINKCQTTPIFSVLPW